MSKVISFRLNPANPREAEALAILQEWTSKGFNPRHTLTEALLMLDSGKSPPLDDGTLNNLTNIINQLLETIEAGSSFLANNSDILLKGELSDRFVASICNAAKPGLKPDI